MSSVCGIFFPGDELGFVVILSYSKFYKCESVQCRVVRLSKYFLARIMLGYRDAVVAGSVIIAKCSVAVLSQEIRLEHRAGDSLQWLQEFKQTKNLFFSSSFSLPLT